MDFESDRSSLRLWTIYENPRDYPGKYVVRESRAKAGKLLSSVTPTAVADSLDEARSATQRAGGYGLARIPRHPTDDPVIVEVWI